MNLRKLLTCAYHFSFDKDDPAFFSAAVRISIISYILQNQKFSNSPQDMGIRKLIVDGVYKAAYPLHDVS